MCSSRFCGGQKVSSGKLAVPSPSWLADHHQLIAGVDQPLQRHDDIRQQPELLDRIDLLVGRLLDQGAVAVNEENLAHGVWGCWLNAGRRGSEEAEKGRVAWIAGVCLRAMGYVLTGQRRSRTPLDCLVTLLTQADAGSATARPATLFSAFLCALCVFALNFQIVLHLPSGLQR
jgi:hypothetical protein